MIESFRTIFSPPRDLILVVAALWIGLALAEKRTERYGVSKNALNTLAFYSLFGFLLGGRILFALVNHSAFATSPLNLFSINIDLFDPASGLLIAILTALVYSRRQNLQLWNALDALTPVFALIAIGLHLSHLAAGTAFGSPTDLPWGIELWNETRHPTQVYELIASLIIFSLLWLRKTELSPGILFVNFAALTASARLFLEAFRGDSSFVFGEFRLAQIFSWLVLAIALLAREAIQAYESSSETKSRLFM